MPNLMLDLKFHYLIINLRIRQSLKALTYFVSIMVIIICYHNVLGKVYIDWHDRYPLMFLEYVYAVITHIHSIIDILLTYSRMMDVSV